MDNPMAYAELETYNYGNTIIHCFTNFGLKEHLLLFRNRSSQTQFLTFIVARVTGL